MAAEGEPDMPAVDPSGRTTVRLGDVEFVGSGVHNGFDQSFLGRKDMQLSQFLAVCM